MSQSRSVSLGAPSGATDLANARWFGTSAVHEHCESATDPSTVFGKAMTVKNGGIPMPPLLAQENSGPISQCLIEVLHSDTLQVWVTMESFPVRRQNPSAEPVDLADLTKLATSLLSGGYAPDTATAKAGGADYAFVKFDGPKGDVWFVGGKNVIEVRASAPLTREEIAALSKTLLAPS